MAATTPLWSSPAAGLHRFRRAAGDRAGGGAARLSLVVAVRSLLPLPRPRQRHRPGILDADERPRRGDVLDSPRHAGAVQRLSAARVAGEDGGDPGRAQRRPAGVRLRRRLASGGVRRLRLRFPAGARPHPPNGRGPHGHQAAVERRAQHVGGEVLPSRQCDLRAEAAAAAAPADHHRRRRREAAAAGGRAPRRHLELLPGAVAGVRAQGAGARSALPRSGARSAEPRALAHDADDHGGMGEGSARPARSREGARLHVGATGALWSRARRTSSCRASATTSAAA